MSGFSRNILYKLNVWQNYKLFWLLIIIISCSFNMVALFYQIVLQQPPCEYCVYQRLAIFIIISGCIIITINPKCTYIKQIGLLIITTGSFYGLHVVIKKLYSELNQNSLFAACSLKPKFPFDLPLDDWLPIFFKVQADCHATEATFLGIPFSYWMLLIFIGYSIFCAFLWFINKKRSSVR